MLFSEKVNPLFKKRSNIALFDSFTLCAGLCKIRIFHLFLSPPIDKYWNWEYNHKRKLVLYCYVIRG